MSFDSENPEHEVYIAGFPLLGKFIPFNTGVERENTINTISDELTSGKTYTKYLNEKSEELKFKTVLTDELADKGYEKQLKKVVKKAKKKPVKMFFNRKTFMGRVISFSIEFPTDNYREYHWHIIEHKKINIEKRTFNTFNYKKAKIRTKLTPWGPLRISPSMDLLLKCNMVYDCKKMNIACVTAWQKRMKSDGVFKSKVNGEFCKETKTATKKWQKKYKIKQTGKFDKATKKVLVNRFVEFLSNVSAAQKKKIISEYTDDVVEDMDINYLKSTLESKESLSVKDKVTVVKADDKKKKSSKKK